jgi:hypothetical protein
MAQLSAETQPVAIIEQIRNLEIKLLLYIARYERNCEYLQVCDMVRAWGADWHKSNANARSEV